MKKLIAYILLTIFLFINTNAQVELPGVTEELRVEIQIALDALTQNSFQLGSVLNVESSLGDCMDPLFYPSYDSFEDPYNTLLASIVFTASNRDIITSDYSDCLIGIYKNDNIFWTTPLTDGIKGNQTPGIIWSIKDINDNGKVEIISSWIQGAGGIPNLRYLILTWDGTDGVLINSTNSLGYSAIRTKVSNGISYVDVEGDGIWELQVGEFDRSQDEEIITTYSWNGSEYGRWPDTPQPQGMAVVPRNFINANISASCNNGTYIYTINSVGGRFQNINTFAIDQEIESINFLSTRYSWKTLNSFSLFVWKNYPRAGCNYIHPGEQSSEFVIEAVESLPVIVNSYLAGWNGSVSRTNTSLATLPTNSFQGRTIAPKTIPNPFDPLAFIDNMIDMGDEAESLDWIGTPGIEDQVWSSLKTKLNNTYDYIDDSNYRNAEQELDSFLTAVEDYYKGRTQYMTSEGYALMNINGEYLIDYVRTFVKN
ncbi:MAG: hypothetical protein HND52_19560 [Ignavibacteriae bacterium]|nr:hypothetical protein [Ignavibacteriota bacterium]NOH00165.1 hypothetical protein [Ignavibacteriota bacterium]